MTACIVGWAHTPVRPARRRDGREPDRAGRRARRWPMPASRAGDVDEIVLGHFNAGFSAQDFTASLVLQASPDLRFKRATPGRECLRHRFGRRASGPQGDRGQGRAHRAGGRRRADDDDARGRDRAQPAQGLLRARGGRYRRRLRRHLRPDRRRSISSDGATSPTRSRASPPRTTRTASAIPTRRCARISATSSAAPRARRIRSSPARSSAPTARWSPTAPPPWCWPMSRPRCKLGKAVAFRAAEHVQDFLPMSKRDMLKFEGCARGLEARAGAAPASRCRDLSFVETHDCFTIAELIEYEAMGLVPEGQGARAIAEGLTEKNGRLPVNPSGGLKAKGHPIGATGVSMHALTRDAADRHGRRHAGEERQARRHLQHGRHRGRELREHPRADQVDRVRPVAWRNHVMADTPALAALLGTPVFAAMPLDQARQWNRGQHDQHRLHRQSVFGRRHRPVEQEEIGQHAAGAVPPPTAACAPA